jgi:hypothetical protein
MNERSRPARRLPENSTRGDRNRLGGRRAWEREVRAFSDEDLLACVRAQASVDRAVIRYRKADTVTFAMPL